MTSVQQAPPAAPAPPEAPGEGAGTWGWLDTAGLAAAVMLAVIAVDMWTDGRFFSRRLFRSSPPQPEEAPDAGD